MNARLGLALLAALTTAAHSAAPTLAQQELYVSGMVKVGFVASIKATPPTLNVVVTDKFQFIPAESSRLEVCQSFLDYHRVVSAGITEVVLLDSSGQVLVKCS